MKILDIDILNPVVDAWEIQLKILGLDKFNELFVELLPTHELCEELEAAKLDSDLAVLVEVKGLVVLMVEDVHLGETIDCVDSIAKIIFRIRHSKYRLKYVCAGWHVEVVVARDKDLVLFELDIPVEFVAEPSDIFLFWAIGWTSSHV